MKTKLICIIAALALLCGCGSKVERAYDAETPSMFVRVEYSTDWQVVYHRETRVMYAVSNGYRNSGNFTLLVNADGTPMLWED